MSELGELSTVTSVSINSALRPTLVSLVVASGLRLGSMRTRAINSYCGVINRTSTIAIASATPVTINSIL